MVYILDVLSIPDQLYPDHSAYPAAEEYDPPEQVENKYDPTEQVEDKYDPTEQVENKYDPSK